MTINVNCPPRGLFIGHETENAARALTVDFSAWAAEYSTGTLQILFQRPGTEGPYAVVLTRDGTTATWKPSETDLAEAGTGAVQIIYTVGDVRVKTSIIPVMVEPSLGVETDPPDGWTSWIDQLTDLAAETEQHAASAAESAENAGTSAEDAQQYATEAGDAKTAAIAAAEAAAASVSHYPQIVGGVWYVWSPAAGAYVSTGIDAQGEDGVSPTVEITAIQGGHRVVITDAEGSHTFDVLDGVTPDLSAYRTAADQDVIDDAQDDQIADLKSAFEAHEQYAEETYAKQDGTYEDLTAGNAYELLSDRGDTNRQPYLFRQTGDDSSAYNREQLKKIVGGTVAWNQLLPANPPGRPNPYTKNGLTFVTNADGGVSVTGTFSGGDANFYVGGRVTAIKGHQYLCFGRTSHLRTSFYGAVTLSVTPTASGVVATAANDGDVRVYFRADSTLSQGDTLNETVYAQLFDLTQMFGTAIADYIYSLETASAGAGVAFFRKLFPADYYDYNPGELKSVEGVSAHETVGFNQWDEEWEVGMYNDSGAKTSATNRIRNANPIRVLPSTAYYVLTASWCFEYDENLNFIRKIQGERVITTSSNARYLNFMTFAGYGTTYNHDICINLSDPKRNGTYEPYKKHTYPLDSSLTLRGVPKLDSNNRLYYDGDEYEPDGTVTRRYGVVDLGTLGWTGYSASLKRAYASLPGIKYDRLSTVIRNILPSALLHAVSVSYFDSHTEEDAQVCVNNTNEVLWVRMLSATSASDYVSMLSGVYLVYELATPTTETAEPYRELEICYRDGTEEFVSTSIVPVGHETFYPVNVFDYIDRLTEPDADMIADSAIAANKYFSVGNRLFLSTASIAAGAQIIPGTNCTETSLAAALNALNA